MQAVILAAGKGTRLLPHTTYTAKPMIELCGKPVLHYVLDALPDPIQEIIIIVNHLKEQIMENIGGSWKGIPVTYVVQDPLDGTGSAVHAVKQLLHDKFLVLNADDLYVKRDLERLVEHPLGILLMPTTSETADSALIDDQGNFVALEANAPKQEIKQKVCGAYILDERFFDVPLTKIQVGSHEEFGLPHTLVTLGKDCPIKTETASFWMQIGTPTQLEAARTWCANEATKT